MGVGADPFAPMQSVGKWAEHRTKAKPNGWGRALCVAWAADVSAIHATRLPPQEIAQCAVSGQVRV